MFKKIIALVTALFLNGCSTTQEYIQISAEEFKEELINLSKYNNNTRNCIWVYLVADSKESQNYLYFQLNCFDLNKKNSVINILKHIKINNKTALSVWICLRLDIWKRLILDRYRQTLSLL